jgi:hypothetical protein
VQGQALVAVGAPRGGALGQEQLHHGACNRHLEML